ncbi:hypothetical protein XBKQ1_580067 [Xenorhabdus bovienii str. kraussei Quebec]|uniref:Uncharacterized protein n=2 Tax=Xenorhabdus bovienii TaxID=40576 RepID=A0A077PB46_XENBV|nr:hypothetical protein XBKQ1_580067 [Xenorhabdus bovienii str. kraussei Quebec]CDH32857.1 hypothetical protein XBI1_2280006 [Xenorhabdus bovienii str. Intermedium]
MMLAFWRYKSFTCGQLLAILAVITTIILYFPIISEYYVDHLLSNQNPVSPVKIQVFAILTIAHAILLTTIY